MPGRPVSVLTAPVPSLRSGTTSARIAKTRPRHLGRDVDVLQSAQQARDVVARFTLDLDRADVPRAELQLGRDDLAHGALE
jgi:hypothetical protein